MALADIQAKIADDARAEAQAIIAQADEQAAKIRAEADREIEAIRSDFAKRAEAEEKEIFRRREVVRRVDEKKIELNAKRRLLDRVFSEAVAALAGLPDADYRALAQGLLAEAAPKGGETVVLAKGDRRLDAAWLDGAAKALKVELSPAPAEAFAGGLLLQSGRVRIDASLETLVEQARETLEGDVVKRLFQG